MLDQFFQFFAIGLLLAVFFCIWLLVCNERTYRQRVKFLHAWYGPAGPGRMLREFDNTYNFHLWRLVFFMDPKPLYSTEVQNFAVINRIF